MTIRAADLPKDLAFAFIDAIGAWSQVEHDLFMLWQFLHRRPDLDEAWRQFSNYSTVKQRTETEAVIKAKIDAQAVRDQTLAIMEQLKDLTLKRNRIVHGRWGVRNLSNGRIVIGVEYMRIYDARAEPARPVDDIEEEAMHGRSRFDAADLRQAETEFRALARDIHLAIRDSIPFVAQRS